jgi:hypothetical protein
VGVGEAVRDPRPGGHALVRRPEIHRQVLNGPLRTQNKIKNRFYGTLRNYIRFVINFMDQSNTCYNYEISKLSPKFLNDMYKAENRNHSSIQSSAFSMKKSSRPSTPCASRSTRRCSACGSRKPLKSTKN